MQVETERPWYARRLSLKEKEIWRWEEGLDSCLPESYRAAESSLENMAEANLSFRVHTADIGASLADLVPTAAGHHEDMAGGRASQARSKIRWCLNLNLETHSASW